MGRFATTITLVALYPVRYYEFWTGRREIRRAPARFARL
jgi:hypothetical protein